MKTASTKLLLLKLALSFGLFTSGTGAFAQTLPLLPAPNHDTEYTAVISGVVTVEGTTQGVGGVIARLSRVITSPSASLVPVSYAITDLNGAFTLAGQPGITYRITYEFPSAGYTAPQGNPSADFTVVEGANTAPGSGIQLVRNVNTITTCNVKESQATEWISTIDVPKAVQLNTQAILNNVVVFGSTIASHPSIGITAATPSRVRGLRIGASVTLSGPEYSAELAALKTFAGTPSAQNLVLTEGQTLTYYNISSAQSSSTDLGYVPEAYTGSGNVRFDAEAYGAYLIDISGGNTSSDVTTFAAAGVCLTYVYNSDPLPVTLTSFSAKKSGENVSSAKLEWKTSSESQSREFEIQRSNDGKAWEQIGTVLAQGESNTITHYEFSDENPFAGENLYRLKMVDLDGTFALSSIRNVSFEAVSPVLLHPNPVSDMLTIKSLSTSDVAEVTVFNLTGIPVLSKKWSDGANQIDMSKLSPGLYMVKTVSKNGSSNAQKVIVTK